QKIAAPRTASPASKTENSDLHRANSLAKSEKSLSQTENPVSKPAEPSRPAQKTPAKTVNSPSKTEKLPSKTEKLPSKTEKLPSKTELLPAKTVTSPSKPADSSSGLQKNPFSIPPAKNGATLVFVIDDAGLNVEFTKRYAGLPFPLTIAVLPKLAHSKECASVVRSYGKELILHQPMQSLNHSLNPGPGKITVDMSFEQIHSIICENLAEIGPGVKGLNNHEGSEVTEDVLRIGAVLDACLENSIYFLDSRTTANTKAPQAALERDIKIFEKSGPYIDNVVTREAMLEEIYRALDAANKNGSSIVIAHVDKSAGILPNLLEQIYPHLVKAGYRFATPSTLR
ncbi:divergent polysaccharide deacetylase family protein, partial [uncultured Treponema sp.]|uniref:divergent polysaccharide deacetylase family protein n=1 Tax=uncultured Treponema sp. TaxID=162155 RepID=UPI0015BFBD4C